MMHPDTEIGFVNETIGYGVFATKFIPKGTITWALDDLDQTFNESYVNSLNLIQRRTLLKYCYRDNRGNYILCWDLGKYVNHSFNANCITTAYEFEVAIRDIYPGEQLTDDYGYLNLDEPFSCVPEPNSYRTKVTPDDILYFYQEWDEKVAEAIKYFNKVEQPLRSFIQSNFVNKVNAAALGKESLDSIITCYYERKLVLV